MVGKGKKTSLGGNVAALLQLDNPTPQSIRNNSVMNKKSFRLNLTSPKTAGGETVTLSPKSVKSHHTRNNNPYGKVL
jgi:hypothetical protein